MNPKINLGFSLETIYSKTFSKLAPITIYYINLSIALQSENFVI